MTENLDWLFALGAWVVGGCGLVLGVWVARGDRARGRRRCPRCWYELGGAPGLVCPECGRDAGSEKRLLRTRRRWRRCLGAMALVVMAVGIHQTPGWVRSGWKGAVPGTWLVMMPQDMAAWLEEFQSSAVADSAYPLRTELVRRVNEHMLAEWQMGWWMGRVKGELTRQGKYGVSAGSRAAAEWLDRPLPEIALKERSVGGIVAALKGAGVPIEADWKSLAFEQVRPETPVAWGEVIEAGMTAKEAVQKVMERIREGDGRNWPVWSVGGGYIRLSAPKGLREAARSVIYEVGDLGRVYVVEYKRDQEDDVSETGSITCFPRRAGDRVIVDSEIVEIEDLLQAVIEPEGWDVNGGDAATIRLVGGRLLIKASESVHIWIESLLECLRSETTAKSSDDLVVYEVSDLVGRASASESGRSAESRSEQVMELIHSLVAAVEPESWTDSGGEVGLVLQFHSKLIVKAPARMQSGVAEFLEKKRREHAAETAAKAGAAAVDGHG